jgi:hypothetical protein
MFHDSPGTMMLIICGGFAFLIWLFPKILMLFVPEKPGKGALIALIIVIAGAVAAFGMMINHLDPHSSVPALPELAILIGVIAVVFVLVDGGSKSE